MKKVLVATFTILLISTSCNINVNGPKISDTVTPEVISTVEATATFTLSPTPTATPKPVLEGFDYAYDNMKSKVSTLIKYNNKIYYTSATELYCYDIVSKSHKLIDDMLTQENIYYYEKYIYYIRFDTLNRIEAQSGEKETIAEAKDRSEDLYKNNDLVEEGAINFNDIYIVDNIMLLELSALDNYYSDIVDVRVILEIGNWKWSRAEDFYEFEYKVLNNDNRTFNYQYVYLSTEEISKKKISLIYSQQYKDGSFGQSASSLEGGLVKAKDKVFTTSWPKSNKYILGYMLESDEEIYRKDLGYSAAKPIALNQYVIIYYYDRIKDDDYDEGEGVILIDTKNDKTYENEEINQLLSGGVDYKVFFNTDYYLDGDILYLKNSRLNEIRYSQDIHNGIYFNDKLGYLKLPSPTNLYKAEVIDGKLHFTLLYKEFDK